MTTIPELRWLRVLRLRRGLSEDPLVTMMSSVRMSSGVVKISRPSSPLKTLLMGVPASCATLLEAALDTFSSKAWNDEGFERTRCLSERGRLHETITLPEAGTAWGTFSLSKPSTCMLW